MEIRLSARNIGEILQEDFCPRCFWFTHKFAIDSSNPFHFPMPSIVSLMDSFLKRIMEAHHAERNSLPPWFSESILMEIPEIPVRSLRPIKVKRWRFSIDENVLLSGTPDVMWELPDGKLFIADFKTAVFTPKQENMLPLYTAQLNAYAYLAYKLEGKETEYLALVYFEPQHKAEYDKVLKRTAAEPALGFKCRTVAVEIWDKGKIEDICQRIVGILSSPTPPPGREGCEKCKAMKNWLEEITSYLNM